MAGFNVGSAEVDVRLNDGPLLLGLKKVQAETKRVMKDIDRQEAQADVTADITDLKNKIREAKRELGLLAASEPSPELEMDRAHWEEQVAQTMTEIAVLEGQKIEVELELENMRQLQKEWKLSEKRALEYAKAVDKAAVADDEHAASVGRLRNQYIRVYSELRKVEDSQGRLHRMFGIADPRIAGLNSELGLLRRRLQLVGESTEGLDIDVDRHNSTLGRWANSVANIRIHLGIMSLTLRQIAIAGFLFGHVISALVASASALIGTIGTGLVGALGLGSAAFAGFGLAATGSFFIMKPLISSIGDAQEATQKYDEAVQKYGKSSEQAKTAMQQMNRILGQSSAATREAVQQSTQLDERWERLTREARPAFYETFGQGIRTINALMPTFARESVKTFDALAQGTQEWLRGLRSPEAKSLLTDIMRNFRESIPNMMQGLGDLATAFARIAASFSRHLAPTTKTFAEWARGIERGTRSASDLDSRVDGLMSHLRSLGRFLTASGRLIGAFFSSGAQEGQGLLDSITAQFNEWTAWIRSVEGDQTLNRWFERGISEVKKFGSILGNIATFFSDFSRAFGFIAQGVTTILDGITSIVDAIRSIPVIGDEIIDVAGFVAAGAIILSWIGRIRAGLAGLAIGGILSGAGGAAAGAAGGAAAGGLTGFLARLAPLALRAAGPIGALTAGLLALKEATQGDILSFDDWAEARQEVIAMGESIKDLNRVAGTDAFADVDSKYREAFGRMEQYARDFGQSVRVELGQRALSEGLDITDIAAAFRGQTSNMASNIDSLARKIGKIGGAEEVANIFVKSDSAEETIKRLEQLLDRLEKRRTARIDARTNEAVSALLKVDDAGKKAEKDRKVDVKAPTADDVVNDLFRVDDAGRQASKPRVVPISEKGASNVMGQLGNIFGFNLPDKIFSIIARDQFSSVRAAAQAPIKDIYYSIIGRHTRTKAEGGLVAAAMGAGPREVEKAAKQARGNPEGRRGVSQKVARPTILTGEEPGHPEWVIATNPAYRQTNLAYLAAAAHDLGAAVVQVRKQGGPLFGPRSKYESLRHAIGLSENLYANQQRSYTETLNATGIPTPDLETLMDTKRGSIKAVERLREHITGSMYKRIAKQIRSLTRQRGRAKGKKNRDKRKELDQKREDLKDRKAELGREVMDLDQERYSLLLDLDELVQGRVSPGGTGGFGEPRGVQEGALNAARLELFRTFASNFNPITASLGGMVNRFGSGFSTPSIAPSSPSMVAAGGGGGFTQINNFEAPPPDPHTWAQQSAWEAGAVG